jgi:hypothetical protein
VHNVRVPPPRRRLPALTALTAASALVLGACSSGADGAGGSDRSTQESAATTSAPAPTPRSPSASSTVRVPEGVRLTDQGSRLTFGQSATVIFEPTQERGSVLQLTVRSVRRGTLADFKGFILDDAYKKRADYYYATVRVRNVGTGNVGGVPVPLWGVNAANTLLPAVNFTTTFAKCPSRPLPASFGAGATLDTCLVYLSPNKGSLRAVSYRPSQAFNPVTWTGRIAEPPTAKATPKPKSKKKG